MKSNRNAIILCSGGLDSAVCAHYVKKRLKYDKLIFLFFDYGQRALLSERKCAKKCSNSLKAEFMEIKLDEFRKISFSLINKHGNVKRIKKQELKDTKKESEKWYVPFRNGIFISYALALAESLYIKSGDVFDIFTGFQSEGREAYPDTTEEFVNHMNLLAKVSCIKPFLIKAPLIKKDKDEIIKLGKNLGVVFEDTFSCYTHEGKGKHCGYCLNCALRKQGFYWAGVKDLTDYAS